MTKSNFIFLSLLALAVMTWGVFSGGVSGYTSRSARIIARTTSVESSISGLVVHAPPAVGTKVSARSLLATIQNDRIDRGRLVELQSQRDFLRSEIANVQRETGDLLTALGELESQSDSYRAWMADNLRLLRKQAYHDLKAAEERHALKVSEVDRARELHKKSHVSDAVLQDAKSNAVITRNQVEALRAGLSRIDLRLRSAKNTGILREDGETSYWDETMGAVRMRLLENQRKISTMRAQSIQFQTRTKAERERLENNFVEEHRAPFDGIINAVFVLGGEHVVLGAPLLEVLDCANPIAIVPIPENRFSDFWIGQRATVNPIDSDRLLAGTIQHISSGALIGRDTTIAANPDLALEGAKLIVAFENDSPEFASEDACDTARRAIVTIHTESIIGKISDIINAFFNDAKTDVEIAGAK